MSGPIDLGPLTAAEQELAWRVAGSAEAALGSRQPVLVCEVLAHLLSGLLYENRDREEAEATNLRVVQHMLGRVEALARENEALARAVVARATDGGQD